MPDHVFIDRPDDRVEVGPAESDPRFVQHVNCDGAYFHALHWDCHGAKCSEPRCIINKGRPDCVVGAEQ